MSEITCVAGDVDDRGELVRIISLEGEWDLSRGQELRRRLEPAAAHPRVVIDLSHVTFMDSPCVGMLVRLRTRRVAKGYEAERLVVGAGSIRRVLGALDSHSLWRICESLEQALEGWKHRGHIALVEPT